VRRRERSAELWAFCFTAWRARLRADAMLAMFSIGSDCTKLSIIRALNRSCKTLRQPNWTRRSTAPAVTSSRMAGESGWQRRLREMLKYSQLYI
jgi:hypothetical protein